jgi:hypothetical protein
MDRGDNQQEEWLWFSQEDSQKLNDALSNTPTAPLMVEVSKNHTVDLSRWDSHGVATETSGRNGKKYMVRRGAGLPATALIKVSPATHYADGTFHLAGTQIARSLPPPPSSSCVCCC